MAYFNKEAYEKLRKDLLEETYGPGAGNAEQDLTFLHGCGTAASDDVREVVEEQCLRTLRTRTMGTGEIIYLAQEQDRRRHEAHEALIVKVNILNRLAGNHGAGKIYTGDENDRYQIGDFACELVSDIFKNRAL